MPRWLVPGLVVALAAPIAVAVLAQRDAGWHPVFDLAMTELRVRDVGGAHTPLVGLQGRIGPTGSHPGPLSFYLLAPPYRLFGSTAFALQAATGLLHLAAAVTALLVVWRRRHGWAVISVAVVLLLLMVGYGLGTLTEPWNPHLPVLWFVAFLVSAWAVLDGDLPMVVPIVVSGSLCAQTHVPYLAVTLGIGVGVAGLAAVRAWLRRRDGEPVPWRWAAIGLGVGVLLWTPPLIDEVINEPGNLSQIVDHLGTPVDEPIGIREAGTFVLERLDAWQLVVVEPRHPGTFVDVLSGPGPQAERGALTLAIWTVCAAAALSLRHRRLLALHAVVGGGVVVAAVAISRIHGVPWPYLMQWGFGLGALMLVSIVATVVVLARRWLPAVRRPATTRALGLAGTALVALLAVRLLLLAPDATTGTPEQTAQLARLVGPTARALEEGAGAASGDGGRYKVTWFDATHGGSEGIGMVNELIRRGYDVGVHERDRIRIGAHRVRDDAEATAHLVMASGGWIERIEAEPGAVRIAEDDARTPAEAAEYEEVRTAAIAALRDNGREDLVDRLDTDLFDVALNQGIPVEVSLLIGRMLDIGVPVAVFVLPEAPA